MTTDLPQNTKPGFLFWRKRIALLSRSSSEIRRSAYKRSTGHVYENNPVPFYREETVIDKIKTAFN